MPQQRPRSGFSVQYRKISHRSRERVEFRLNDTFEPEQRELAIPTAMTEDRIMYSTTSAAGKHADNSDEPGTVPSNIGFKLAFGMAFAYILRRAVQIFRSPSKD
ncbi:hypothetical protein BKA70DRAFT_1569636 [Coprinopsis sp. MPI-PUGE-AT-0042]|nr:hypothetical protein BKA70DRAFT_1569636 [Coprinopsis sp. MPI-PUGE-AT-0042]